MHELFLAAVVPDADVSKARALLGGFTEMGERHQFTRIHHYAPQNLDAKGFPTIKELQKERSPNTPQWQELHQILARQPCTVQVRIPVTDEIQSTMNGGGEATVPANKPRVLRWTELPDPPSPRVPDYITQRKIIDITDQRAETILTDNKFRLKSDLIDESYHWWLNDIEYALTRTFIISLSPDPATAQQVPNLASIEPAADFWLLLVRSRVESKPEPMQQSQNQLAQVREQLLGVFEFKVFDRRCHDPRVQEQRGQQGPA